jgi:hypothetical protein
MVDGAKQITTNAGMVRKRMLNTREINCTTDRQKETMAFSLRKQFMKTLHILRNYKFRQVYSFLPLIHLVKVKCI